MIKCVYWEGRYFITGADVIKIVQWRLKMANISILNFQKFEQQVYSDLRRLRIGKDAIIEEADSNFLRFLDALNSVKTRKKQKVFFWESVSVSLNQYIGFHDKLMPIIRLFLKKKN